MPLNLKSFRTKRYKYRTLEIVPFGSVSPDARVVSLDLKPDDHLDPLIYWVIATTCLVFLFNSLDLVTRSEFVRKLIIDSINWGTLYQGFFPTRFWTPVTSMWYHSTWEHLFGNLTGFYISALWLSRVYDSRAWRWFYLVGGPLAGIGFLYTNTCPPADFTHWHGALAAVTGEPNTPLAGASGGCFAMIGATLAAAVRYRLAGVKSWMQVSLPFLLALPVLQFICVDLGNSGIAGLAHQLALVFGFVLGLIPRLKSNVTVITSAPQAIAVDSVTVDDRNKLVVGAVYRVAPTFDDDKDFLIKKQEYIGFKSKPDYKLVGGRRPPDGAFAATVPMYVRACIMPADVYKTILKSTSRIWVMTVIYMVAVAALCQWVFSKYSAPNYPSIFVANLAFGVLLVTEALLNLRSTLQWQQPPAMSTTTAVQVETAPMSIGNWH